jgi:hypothetical protein
MRRTLKVRAGWLAIWQVAAVEVDDMAKRIRARATRRAGELLKEIEPQRGGDRVSDQYTASDTLVTRQNAAEEAGLSKRQADTAKRLASIPEDDFEEMVEGGVTVTVLCCFCKARTHSYPQQGAIQRESFPKREPERVKVSNTLWASVRARLFTSSLSRWSSLKSFKD